MTADEENEIAELANQISDVLIETDCNEAQQLIALATAASLVLCESWPPHKRPAAFELFRMTLRECMEGEPDRSLN